MFVAPPTLLSRAMRNNAPLLLCTSTTMAMTEAILDAASRCERSIVLVVSAGEKELTLAQQGMLAWMYWRAERATSSVGIAIESSRPHLLPPELSAAFPGLTLLVSDIESFDHPDELRALHQSHPGWTIIPDLIVAATPDRVGRYVQESTASALRIQLPHNRQGVPHVSPEYLKTLRMATKVPLIAREAQYAPATLKQFVHAGVAGISLGEELNAAYTAGMRTALRSRSTTDPRHYEHIAAEAVRDRILTYLTHIK
jgi:fructose/tagatose bisphosphate aldolase